MGKKNSNSPSLMGERIRLLRRQAGLRQIDLAHAAAVDVQTVYLAERHGRDLRSSYLARVAAALNCSSDFLLGLTAEPAPQRRIQEQ